MPRGVKKATKSAAKAPKKDEPKAVVKAVKPDGKCVHVAGQSILGSDGKLTRYCGLCGAKI